jgi:hypothetical protein
MHEAIAFPKHCIDKTEIFAKGERRHATRSDPCIPPPVRTSGGSASAVRTGCFYFLLSSASGFVQVKMHVRPDAPT